MRPNAPTCCAAALAAALASAPRTAAAPSAGARGAIQGRAVVSPAVARLGERVVYRGRVVFPSERTLKWLPPESGGDFTWGQLFPRRLGGPPASAAEPAAYDTLEVETSLQIFRTGTVVIPGLRFQDQDPIRPVVYSLPVVRLEVASVLAAADSNADLRPLRGPIEAPWWERVPWRIVIIGVAILVALVYLLRRLRRKVPAPALAPPARDPGAEALAALAALRGLELPAHGRFAEHALHLSRIVRRLLESTSGVTHPGDTTPELLRHLQSASLDTNDLASLQMLLGHWDRLKFGRAPSSIQEAVRAEIEVEAMVRRQAPVPVREAA